VPIAPYPTDPVPDGHTDAVSVEHVEGDNVPDEHVPNEHLVNGGKSVENSESCTPGYTRCAVTDQIRACKSRLLGTNRPRTGPPVNRSELRAFSALVSPECTAHVECTNEALSLPIPERGAGTATYGPLGDND
jgi:hypothetical protein